MKHTQLPWQFDREGYGALALNADVGKDWKHVGVISANGDGFVAVTPEEAEANAEFIVRAVNNHDALLGWVEILADLLRGDLTLPLSGDLRAVEKLIAKAKGG